jgi:hypothetical protein
LLGGEAALREERVALRVDLVALGCGERGAQEALVVAEDVAVRLAELFQQPRRPFRCR